MLRSYSLLGNKHIPLVYKTASRSDRLKLLAGLVDSDGHLDMGCFDFCQKSSILADDIAYLARSLGYAVHRTTEYKSCTNSKRPHSDYYQRVRISGELSEVPTFLPRKKAEFRKQIKNVLRTGFTVESLGDGEYYGFTIDKDKLFLLGDFTVTHNTASITQYCQMAIKEDPGTVVIVWPTSQIESEWVLDFLERKIEYTKKCTRVILIMEDIGGGERENQGESRGVDSALLDLLDGLRTVFKLPTFMIATTNYPQNLLSALADRPGRFDMMLELDPPSYEEKVQLVEFIAKRSLTEEEKDALSSKELKDFSVAHLKEIVVRSMIHDKTIPQVIKELVAHKKKFHDAFAKKAKDSMGFNL
jgi:SpoVK/Ycf46/Vps4 family AAA+-type ATPase